MVSRHYLAVNLLAALILADDTPATAAQLRATLLCRGEGSLRAGADHAGLQLSHRNHLLQHEAAGGAFDLRQVGETYVDASLEQAREEGHRARKAIHFADHQR